jgi:hypothetical protein
MTENIPKFSMVRPSKYTNNLGFFVCKYKIPSGNPAGARRRRKKL